MYDALKTNEKQIALAIIYTEKDVFTYDVIEEKIVLILQRLIALQDNTDTVSVIVQ